LAAEGSGGTDAREGPAETRLKGLVQQPVENIPIRRGLGLLATGRAIGVGCPHRMRIRGLGYWRSHATAYFRIIITGPGGGIPGGGGSATRLLVSSLRRHVRGWGPHHITFPTLMFLIVLLSGFFWGGPRPPCGSFRGGREKNPRSVECKVGWVVCCVDGALVASRVYFCMEQSEQGGGARLQLELAPHADDQTRIMYSACWWDICRQVFLVRAT